MHDLRTARVRGGLWPAEIPAVVLTGDHRRDLAVNRLVRACLVRDIDELLARRAAALRTATRPADDISATDAIVATFVKRSPDPVVMTIGPDDLAALTACAPTTR